MPRKGKDVRVKGTLELEPILRGTKALDKEIGNLLGKINNTKKVFGQQGDAILGDAKKDLENAQKLLESRAKSTEKILRGERDFDKLLPSQQKAVLKDLAGLERAVADAKTAYGKVNAAAKEVSDPKLYKELTDSYKAGTASIKNLEQTNAKLRKATDKNVIERTKQAAIAKQETLDQKKRLAAQKLNTSRLEQQAKERAARTATGRRIEDLSARDLQQLTPAQKSAVGQAISGRVALAQQRQNLANYFGKEESAIKKADAALQKALATRNAYNKLTAEGEKLRKESATVDKRIAQERRKENQIAAAFAKREKEQQAQQLRDAQTRERGFVEIEKNRAKAAAEAQKEQATAAKSAAREYKAYVDEQTKLDEKAYKARKAQRQRQAKEEEALRVKNEKLAQRRSLQRAQLAQKKTLAGDVFAGYGASGFKDIDFRTIQRQDLKPLQDYAKAQQQIALGHLQNAKNAGKSSKTVAAASANYEKHSRVVRELEARYRALHSPLQQVNLLFRQFFRFAIGYGALYQALGAIRALVTGVLDLDEQLRSIQAITASTDKQMKSLEVTIKRVATTTKFTTSEIADATRVLGQAGVTAGELPEALRATANFAAATNSELEIAADLITTFRNVFKELDDNTIADQLTKAINISKLTAADLKTVLSLSAQTAKAYNLTSEQYLSAVTTLRNAGIKASTVATGLRQGLIEIFSPDTSTLKVLRQRYRQLGENVTDELVKQRFFSFTKDDNPLLAVLTELKRLGFADEAQKEFGRAFDVRAANAIKALIANYDELAAAETKITFGLSAAEAANIQMKSLNNSLKNLGAAFTVLGDQVLGGAVSSLEKFTDSATEAVTALADLDIQLKQQGKQGLGAALIPALGGAVAGGLAGRTIKGKLLGTAIGGTAGAAAGVGEGGISLAGSGVLTGLFALLAGTSAASGVGSIASSIKDFKSGKAASAVGLGTGSKILQKVIGGRATAGILAFIPAVGPILSAVFTIGSIFLAFSDLLSSAKNPAEAAANRAEAATALLERAKDRVARIRQFSEEFDVEAARQRPESGGKAADAIVGLEKDLADYSLSVERVFGNIAEGKAQRFQEIIERFSSARLAERLVLAKELREITDIDANDAELDRLVFDISTEFRNLKDNQEALAGELRVFVEKSNEIVQQAIQDGVDLTSSTDEELNRALAILSAFKDDERIQRIVRGTSQAPADKQAEYIANFAQNLSKLEDDLLKSEIENLNKANRDAIRAQINLAVAGAKESDFLNLELTLDAIVDGVQGVGEVAQSQLQIIREELESAQQELRSYRPPASTPRVRGAYLREPTRPGRQPAASTIDATLGRIDSREQELEEQTEAVRIAAIEQAQGAIQGVVDLLQEDAGRGTIERGLESVGNDEAKRRITELLSSPDKLAEFAEGIGDDVYVDENNKVRFKNGVDGILSLFEAFVDTSNEAREAAKKSTTLKALLPSPRDIQLISDLEKEIGQLQGKNKENITRLLDPSDPTNPINQLRDAKARELERAIARTLQDIDDLGQGPEDEKTVERKNDLQIKLNKQQADLASLDEEASDAIQSATETYINIILKNRQRLAELSKELAEENISLSGSNIDSGLFNNSLQKIDQANAELLEVFRQQLIRDGLENGFKEGSEIFNAELEERRRLLRPLRENAEQFNKYLEEYTAGFREQARLLREKPVSAGGSVQDAVSESQGVVGNARRRQRATFDQAATVIDAAGIGTQIGELEKNLEIQKAAGREADVAKTEETLRSLRTELEVLDQRAAALTITMMENSASAEERAQAELLQIGNTQAFIEALQDSNYAFNNFAENLRNTIIGTVEEIGAALADFIIDGGDLTDILGNILHNFGRELLNQGIQTIINEGLQSIVSALPAQIVGSLPIGGLATSAAETAKDAVTGGAEGAAVATAVTTAVTAGLTPATAALSSSGFQLGGAAIQLNTAALALNGAATALTTAAGASGASGAGGLFGGLFGGGGGAPTVRTGGLITSSGIQRFARGGLIKGPGSGTSDSIAGLHLNGKDVAPIMVSNGEAILNAKAVELLGEDFIHAMNSGKMSGFNTGAVADRSKLTSSGAAVREVSSTAPTVENNNATTIVNAIDSSSVVAAGLETPAGGRAIMNFMRANKSKIQRIIQ